MFLMSAHISLEAVSIEQSSTHVGDARVMQIR